MTSSSKINLMKKIILTAFLSSFGLSTQIFAQQISFSPISNLDMMIANIFGVQCDGVSNVQLLANPSQVGRFENGAAIGVNSGLVLSTGIVENSSQPSIVFTSTGLGSAGDVDIANFGSAAGQIPTNYDACNVEFDFTPSVSDTVRFTYLLASEEYPEYSNTSFTDRFLFLVSENGGTPVNIAFLPGTNLPVEINSVNQIVNSQYYIDNLGGPNAGTFVFDGYTTPFEAKFFAQVGSSYHIKLVLADVSDAVFDSAIFLEEQESYNDISGNLTVDGLPGEGLLEIFNFVGDTLLATPVYSAVVSNGQYLADSLTTGMYHVRFTPDPVLFPLSNPFYFVGGDTWSQAQAIGLPCFLDQGNINSNTLGVLSGNASISGIVSIDTSYTKILMEPFEGALIKLVNQADEVVAFTYSAADGSYTFTGVETGNYHLLIDVPYIPQTNEHDIQINSNELVYGADFEILPEGIIAADNLYLNVGDLDSYTVSVYPNPAKDKFTLFHNNAESVAYTVVSMNGVVVSSGVAAIGKTTIDVSQLENGLYILELGENKRERIIVTK